jgi:RimJ/RimL family protein N-acetyltransferase
MKAYPDSTPDPDELVTSGFRLRPLRTTDVDLDYEAVVESAAMLRRWGGGSWPADRFTLKENLADLAMHEREHESDLAFTYTMMDLSESECLGCVYVNRLSELIRSLDPAKSIPVIVDDRQATVRFWVRQSHLSESLDWRLLQVLIAWFKNQWTFDQVYFAANDRDARQKRLLRKAGLAEKFKLDITGRVAPFVVCGPVLSSGGDGILT